MGYRCCTQCEYSCGTDGSLCTNDQPIDEQQQIMPNCPCDDILVTGACSIRGCAKPDALGVYSRIPNKRTSDGRYVYTKDRTKAMPIHPDIERHAALDETSESTRS
eukprot:CAMPEP_0119320658 /NCGR_PEP_ID=MMETSP1333-20130426/53042_1 /TAXON_ID=418940 /ORGANISM="Scyphosphaera apsteinii, Strain RCC1455" /LENGTH=105 /DNA_ID=CAMNT_0007327421 /DNA_START=175 /DNA_END=489 /DNA_ORIENTATION=+